MGDFFTFTWVGYVCAADCVTKSLAVNVLVLVLLMNFVRTLSLRYKQTWYQRHLFSPTLQAYIAEEDVACRYHFV